MDSLLDINIKAIPVTLLIGAFATWLGKVWATRIAAKDAHKLSENIENQKFQNSKELEKIQTTLDLQKNLIQQAHHNASLDCSEISREQIAAIKQLWNCWLDLRSENAKFRTPHQILKVTELNDPKYFGKIFPYTVAELDSSMSLTMKYFEKIERLRPLIPVQIYQHCIGVSTLYIRIGIRLMLNVQKGTKIIEWYNDESGEFDFSVSGLLNYAISQSLDLPDPKSDMPYITLTKWKEILEEKFVGLMYQFINGSLSRQIEIHSAIRDLTEKQSMRSHNMEN